MRKADEIVLALVRAAIGSRPEGGGLWDSDFVGIAAQEWCEVMDVAFEQGVAGIAADGYQKLVDFEQSWVAHGCSKMDEEWEDERLDWFGEVLEVEDDCRRRLRVAGRFAAELEKVGVRVCVLKGLAFARYYVRPEHRWSCDFDCVLSDFEAGNRVAEGMGAVVDRSEQKHSHIQLDGVHIENHLTCTGADSKGLEDYLSNFLFLPDNERLSGTALELPPLMFDALFCLYHAMTHFVVEEGIELRHVVDWVLIRRELVKQGLYDGCVKDAERFGLLKFLVALDEVADLVEGRKCLEDLTESGRLMWEDILRKREPVVHGRGWLRARLRVLEQMRRNGWKFRLYTDTTAWKGICGSLGRYVRRVVREPGVVKYMFGK